MVSTNGFEDFFYAAGDGLQLYARIYRAGQSRRLPVVCLPGLTRNSRDFHELAVFLSYDSKFRRDVIVFDYRGRGRSDYDPDWKNYNIAVEAQDILSGLAVLGVEQAAFIGTSRGGLILHILAMLRPDILKAVVLNDIGPVIGVEGLAHIRSYLANAAPLDNFGDAEKAQRAVHAAAFPALSDVDWSRLVAALYRNDAGRPVADFDPNLLHTVTGMDLTQPLPAMWQQFEALHDIPVMVIRGENSKLLSRETVSEMQRGHNRIEAITVPGQGHPPMLETGDLPMRIAAFLSHADPI